MDSPERGKELVVAIIAGYSFMFFFTVLNSIIIHQPLAGLAIQFIFSGFLFYSMYQGYTWARILLGVLYAFWFIFLVLMNLSIIRYPQLFFVLLIGFYYLWSAVMLLKNQSVQAFLKEQYKRKEGI